MPTMGRKAADGSSILMHKIKLGCAGMVVAAFAALLVVGAIFDEDDPEPLKAKVGTCMATSGSTPSLVPCESAAADAKILRVFEGRTSLDLCRQVVGATGAVELIGTWRVGGEQGIDVAETGDKSIVCTGPK
ncbi:hypothetical protein [Streptomyces sp. TBY4]|uniref:hypothetical protein n=1 Tax=Streptomyces sp. TBY4 TaxID=2962030 RepID=UPI0020B86AA4|nr:hypothetical protein [Streptomyces sp. TBY4]MCP3758725.1 hypothetical protein [Streptomyces sp. TBY4]